jgi:hypothetical protein
VKEVSNRREIISIHPSFDAKSDNIEQMENKCRIPTCVKDRKKYKQVLGDITNSSNKTADNQPNEFLGKS